jgi:Uma2 family endonuclease
MSTTSRPFRIDEFFKMEELGFFDPDQRYELLDGRVVFRAVEAGPDHAGVIARMTQKLVLALGEKAIVFPQCSLPLSRYSAPMPDLYVVPPRDDFYQSGAPSIAELFAVVEVSGSSLAIDRGEKLRLYARAGVREYWIANLADRTIDKRHLPHDLGYDKLETYAGRDLVRFEAFPAITFTVDELLGPA